MACDNVFFVEGVPDAADALVSEKYCRDPVNEMLLQKCCSSIGAEIDMDQLIFFGFLDALASLTPILKSTIN